MDDERTTRRGETIRGRGTLSRPDARFEPTTRVNIDDGWWAKDEMPPLRTSVTIDTTKSIIARNKSPDIPFDRSINPYRGCEHGCTYCFARPGHAYLGLSPGLDFETLLFAKPEAPALLRQELSNPRYACQPIAIGTNTDPYQPIEREWRIMRGILEVLNEFNHPVTIVTKSALVLRDLDILGPMAARKLAAVALSLTTLDAKLARQMEPRATTPERRLHAMRALADVGIPVCVMTAPVIPGLNDHELEQLLEAARDHGATTAGYVMLRLPLEIKDMFAEWLDANFPLRASHVLSLMRDVRDGELYSSKWGERMRGNGPYAELIRQRFILAARRLQLNDSRQRWRLDTTSFRPPPKAGDQLKLF